jgi:heptosyltransferase-2
MEPNTNYRRILIRGLNWLGDAVMSTPALLRLREAQPKAKITLATPSKLSALWQNHPAVDEVLTLDKSVFASAKRLKAAQAEVAILFPNSFRSALEIVLSTIPERIGFRGSGRSLLLTRAIQHPPGYLKMHRRSAPEVKQLIASSPQAPSAPPPSAHQMHHYLQLVGTLDANTAPLPPLLAVTSSEVASFRSKFQIRSNPLLGLNAGAEYGPAKRWPPERFVNAAQTVLQNSTARVLIFGGPADKPLAAQISAALASSFPDRVISVAGETSLRELMAGLKLCSVLLTNDTGPMHLAAALGVPVVGLFGSTSPELTGPGLPGSFPGILLRKPVPCAPCFLRECPIDFRCMHGVGSDDAAYAVLALLKAALSF